MLAATSLSAQSPGRLPGGGGHWKIPSVDMTPASADEEATSEWRVLDTLHFRIHYPGNQRALAERAARYAEQAHARLSRVLRHRMSAVIPVFVFPSHQDFSAGNFFARSPGETTGGFTDFARRRVVVPFTGDYAALRHVLAHEIVHAFQFDILPGPFYGAYPLWMMEGMAEYLTLGWDVGAESYVRDLVLHGRLPGLVALQNQASVRGYDVYKVGQALFWYMARRYGEERIGFFLKEAAAAGNLRAAFQSAFRMSPEEFDFAAAADLNARYAPALQAFGRGNTADDAAGDPALDPRLRVASFRYHPENHRSDATGFHLQPVIAPDGRRMAYITAAGPFPALAIKAVPGPGVQRAAVDDVTILLRALRSSDYENYQPLTTRLSWSPNGRTLLVAGRKSGRAALLLVEVAEGAIVESFAPAFSAIHFPVFGPQGRRILFTGVRAGQADLYLLDIAAWRASASNPGPGVVRLTNDACYETEAQFARDGRSVYFSANCGIGAPIKKPGRDAREDAAEQWTGDAVDRHIFRLRLGAESPSSVAIGRPEQITRLPGQARHPQSGIDGDLIFSSNFTGVRNMYRIPARVLNGAERNATNAAAVERNELLALTRSVAGIEHVALTVVPDEATPGADDSPPSANLQASAPVAPGEYLVFTERAEGALELKVLPPGIDAAGSVAPDQTDRTDEAEPPDSSPGDPRKITAVAVADAGTRTYDPGSYSEPIALVRVTPALAAALDAPAGEYEPALSFDGVPYLFVGGGTDRDGETRVAAVAAARLADDTGDHQLLALGGYGESPPEYTLDLRYSYLRLRPDFFIGGFRESRAFPVASFFEWNLNSALYDPNFRVLDRESLGIYGGVEYPLSKFSSVSALLEAGTEEILFRTRESDEREQDDIDTRYYSAGLAYRYSNTLYGPYGPLDGQGFLLAYTIPIRPSGDEREVFTLVGDYRLHHWFENDSVFAARAFAGGAGGRDAFDYPFRLGGYATIRGYDFQEFEGRYAFFANLEYRFSLIKYLLFGFPFDWSPGWIRGVLFFDGGAAFDFPEDWQAYESRNRATRDLFLSYGAGIHFENLLWFAFPGVVMKIEWATPYDLKTSEPPRKWRGVFSVGVNF